MVRLVMVGGWGADDPRVDSTTTRGRSYAARTLPRHVKAVAGRVYSPSSSLDPDQIGFALDRLEPKTKMVRCICAGLRLAIRSRASKTYRPSHFATMADGSPRQGPHRQPVERRTPQHYAKFQQHEVSSQAVCDGQPPNRLSRPGSEYESQADARADRVQESVSHQEAGVEGCTLGSRDGLVVIAAEHFRD